MTTPTCLICGHTAHVQEDVGICNDCTIKLLSHFSLKCYGCGSYTFIPKGRKKEFCNTLSARYIAYDVITQEQADFHVVMVDHCPECRPKHQANA